MNMQNYNPKIEVLPPEDDELGFLPALMSMAGPILGAIGGGGGAAGGIGGLLGSLLPGGGGGGQKQPTQPDPRLASLLRAKRAAEARARAMQASAARSAAQARSATLRLQTTQASGGKMDTKTMLIIGGVAAVGLIVLMKK